MNLGGLLKVFDSGRKLGEELYDYLYLFIQQSTVTNYRASFEDMITFILDYLFLMFAFHDWCNKAFLISLN